MCSGGNHTSGTACTPPGQSWWPNKWRGNSSSAWWELDGVLGWSGLFGGGLTQLQPTENNNTFGQLGEIGSKLKLTAFPEKSLWPKSSIPAPSLALRSEDADSWDRFGETAYSNNCPWLSSPSRRAWALTPWVDAPQNLSERGGTINCQTVQHMNLKEGQHQISNWGELPNAVIQLRGNPLLSIRKNFGQWIYIYTYIWIHFNSSLLFFLLPISFSYSVKILIFLALFVHFLFSPPIYLVV
jgi:hypothetical protein